MANNFNSNYMNINTFNNPNPMNQINQNMINPSTNYSFQMNNPQPIPNNQNMQVKNGLIITNCNDMSNILSLICLPIIIPFHIHPLINCKTPGRVKPNTFWSCNNCKSNYSYDVPSFYCTACDYDLCQNCLLSLNASDITIYNYRKYDILESQELYDSINKSQKYLKSSYINIHKHPIMRILREPCYLDNYLKCNLCLKDLEIDEEIFYCSLCNFCVCENCYSIKLNK